MESPAQLRALLTSGDVLFGTFLKLPSSEVVELAHLAGFDFVVVDREHSQLSAGDARCLVRVAALRGLPALVRLPEVDPGEINRLLEAGAAGVQLSTVRSTAEVAALVAATRYPPHGRRSVSLAHPAAGYGVQPLTAYLEASRAAAPVLVGQIETATTEDPVDAIAAGLDVLFVGPTDLAVDLGAAGRLDDRVEQRIDDIADAAGRSGVVLGGWVSSPATLASMVARGGRYVVTSSDIQLLGASLAQTVEDLRSTGDS